MVDLKGGEIRTSYKNPQLWAQHCFVQLQVLGQRFAFFPLCDQLVVQQKKVERRGLLSFVARFSSSSHLFTQQICSNLPKSSLGFSTKNCV